MLVLHWVEFRVIESILSRLCMYDCLVSELLTVLILLPLSMLPVVIVQVVERVHAIIGVLVGVDYARQFKFISKDFFKFKLNLPPQSSPQRCSLPDMEGERLKFLAVPLELLFVASVNFSPERLS